MVPSQSLICMKFVAVRARLRFCQLPRRQPEQTSAMEQTRNSRDCGCYETVVSLYKRDAYKWPICVRAAWTTIWFGFDLHLVWQVEPLHIETLERHTNTSAQLLSFDSHTDSRLCTNTGSFFSWPDLFYLQNLPNKCEIPTGFTQPCWSCTQTFKKLATLHTSAPSHLDSNSLFLAFPLLTPCLWVASGLWG